MTTIAFDVLPYPDLLPFDEVLDVLGKVWHAEAVKDDILGRDELQHLGKRERRARRKKLQALRREIRDPILIAELSEKHPAAAWLLDWLEGRLNMAIMCVLVIVSITTYT